MQRLPALLLLVLLVPVSQAHDTTTTEFLEWEQHLFNVNVGAGANSAATVSNTSFVVYRNDSRAVVSGESVIRITGTLAAQGDNLGLTTWTPTAIFDGAASRWKYSGMCILGEFAIRPGTNHFMPVNMECRLVQHYTSGTHGLRVDEGGPCVGSGCPDGTDMTLSFTLVNREWVTVTHRDAHTEAAAIQTNLIASRLVDNQTNANLIASRLVDNDTNEDVAHFRSDFLQYWSQFNGTSFGGNVTNVTVNETQVRNLLLEQLSPVADSLDFSTLVFASLLSVFLFILWTETTKEPLAYLLSFVIMVSFVVGLWSELENLRLLLVAACLLIVWRYIQNKETILSGKK